jgi:hypothetical protein
MRMMRSRGIPLLGVGVGLCVSAAALAAAEDVVSIRGAGIKRTLTCDHREVVATGTGHRLTLLGRCARVTLTGTGHVVHVERLGRASISGMNNRIEWEHALEGERPRVSITGVNNSAVRVGQEGAVSQGESGDAEPEGGVAVEGDSGSVVVGPGGITVDGKKSSRRGRVTVAGDGGTVSVEGESGTVRVTGAAATVSVAENGLRRSYDCAFGQAEVRGNDNELTLRNCRQVTVSGSRNALTLEGPVRLIRVPGDDNRVVWSHGVDGKAPSVETAGSGNSITRN